MLLLYAILQIPQTKIALEDVTGSCGDFDVCFTSRDSFFFLLTMAVEALHRPWLTIQRHPRHPHRTSHHLWTGPHFLWVFVQAALLSVWLGCFPIGWGLS